MLVLEEECWNCSGLFNIGENHSKTFQNLLLSISHSSKTCFSAPPSAFFPNLAAHGLVWKLKGNMGKPFKFNGSYFFFPISPFWVSPPQFSVVGEILGPSRLVHRLSVSLLRIPVPAVVAIQRSGRYLRGKQKHHLQIYNLRRRFWAFILVAAGVQCPTVGKGPLPRRSLATDRSDMGMKLQWSPHSLVVTDLEGGILMMFTISLGNFNSGFTLWNHWESNTAKKQVHTSPHLKMIHLPSRFSCD